MLHGPEKQIINQFKRMVTETDKDDRKILEYKTLMAVYTSAIGAVYNYQNKDNPDPDMSKLIGSDKQIAQLLKRVIFGNDNSSTAILENFASFYTLIERKFVCLSVNKEKNENLNKKEYTQLNPGAPYLDTNLTTYVRLQSKPAERCEKIANNLKNSILDSLDLMGQYVQKNKILSMLFVIIQRNIDQLEGTEDEDISDDIHSTLTPILLCLNHLPEKHFLRREQLKEDLAKPLTLLCKTARYHFFFEPIPLSDLIASDASTAENPKKDGNKARRQKREDHNKQH